MVDEEIDTMRGLRVERNEVGRPLDAFLFTAPVGSIVMLTLWHFS